MSEAYVDLSQAIDARRRMAEYRDQAYLRLITQLNTQAGEIIKDDLGSQFVANCGRDLAGEVVRTCFNTSDYYLTVDQMLRRILVFSYEDEYDPIAEQKAIRGSVYNQYEPRFSISARFSSTFEHIVDKMDSQQSKVFEGERDDGAIRKAYRRERTAKEGVLVDDITGHQEEKQLAFRRDGKNHFVSDLHADHVQARNAAKYNAWYMDDEGQDAIAAFINSADNFQMIHASANTSKGDVRVCLSPTDSSKVVFMNPGDSNYKEEFDITHRATPKQLADATCHRLEATSDSGKAEKLKESGWLNEEGKVPMAVRKELEARCRHSQNAESLVILSHTKYTSVAGDALGMTGASVGKILAGQIIYYAAPPLVYEIRGILREKGVTLHNALEKISSAGSRIGEYVLSHLKDICVNVAVNSLKKFVKCFMDILINLVKATVKKLLKMAKSLVMSTVDATRIIATPGTTRAQKADAVCNLYAVTITNCVVDLLFDFLSTAVHIPSLALFPLQILTSVVCSNLVMLILQEADLFDVRYGFKMNAIRELFASEYGTYEEEMIAVQSHTEKEIVLLTDRARQECKEIYFHLQDLDAEEQSVRESLGALNQMFSMNIDFEGEWNQFLGKTPLALPSE